MTFLLLFAHCRHETLKLITSDVEHCCCTHSLLCTVCCCMQFAWSIRMVCLYVVYIQLVYSTQFVAVHV